MALMVIGIHTNVLSDINSTLNFLTVHGIFRIAVPVFLVINGFYFYPVVTRQKTLQWLKRVAILYAFWMAVYSYFWIIPPDRSLKSILRILETLVIGYHHLWYVAGLLGASIILLLLHRVQSSYLFFSLVGLFACGVAIQYLGNYHVFSGIVDKLLNIHWMHRNAVLFAFPFFGIGYLIHQKNLHQRISVSQAGIAALTGILLLMGEAYFSYRNPANDGGFDNYVSLLVAAPALFMLMMNIDIQGESKNIALYSSAIYFIHPLAIFLTQKVTYFSQTPSAIVVIALSFVLAFFVIRVNKKLNFIL